MKRQGEQTYELCFRGLISFQVEEDSWFSNCSLSSLKKPRSAVESLRFSSEKQKLQSKMEIVKIKIMIIIVLVKRQISSTLCINSNSVWLMQ